MQSPYTFGKHRWETKDQGIWELNGLAVNGIVPSLLATSMKKYYTSGFDLPLCFSSLTRMLV